MEIMRLAICHCLAEVCSAKCVRVLVMASEVAKSKTGRGTAAKGMFKKLSIVRCLWSKWWCLGLWRLFNL